MTFENLIVQRGIVFVLACLLIPAFGSLPVLAQQFSADVVHLRPEGAATTRVLVSGDKMRFEPGGPQRGVIVVVDLRQRAGFTLLPENNTYTLLPPARIASMMPFFRPADSAAACAAWEKVTNKQGSCTKIGVEAVGDREAVKYSGTTPDGDSGFAWIDRKLNYVIKWDGKVRTTELRNIREGPQPAALFEIPKGYEKVGPPQAAGPKVKAGKTRPGVKSLQK